MISLVEAYGGDNNNKENRERAKESVMAIFCEEMAKFVRNEDDKIDLKAIKPILKLNEWILENRLAELKNIKLESKSIKEAEKELKATINLLKEYRKKLN